MSTPRQILKQVFGHDRFRGPQQAIVEHVAAGGDAVVLMPTGGGKSLCYQIPAILRPGTAIVISPLIALMRDQVQTLSGLGVQAECLHSALPAGTAREVMARLRRGELDILYTAPERFMTQGFANLLAGLPLALFAIDEAHCVSQWGHDFRPEYLQLASIAHDFPGVPRMALTATADGPTRADILTRLELSQARVFATGFDRPNIRYLVEPKDHPRRRLLRFIREEHPGQSGIVYRLSRAKTEDTAQWLTDNGIPALAYHAGLAPAERDRRQDRFMREEGLVMAATVAFGMGVDKPDVRFVAHLDPPKSLEAYHQETGRAGRDGEPATALMLYSMNDFAALRRLIAPEGGEGTRTRIDLSKLDALAGYCETDCCRRQTLLGYFGEGRLEPCGNCDVCLDPSEPEDATVAAQKALSCVFRTGQRFGAGHLVDVLLGRPTTQVERFNHREVSTFGIGTDLTKDHWRAIYRRLAAMGALAPDEAGHGGLVLTPLAWEILKGQRPFAMRLPKEPAPKERRKRSRGASGEGGGKKSWVYDHLSSPEDAALWDRLRAWRAETAKEAGVPPYVVFHDRTLLDVVLLKPEDAAGLAGAGGMGQAKIDKYGQTLIAMLAEHYAAHGRAAPRPALPPEAGALAPREPNDTAAKSLALFQELGSVEAVAKKRELAVSTIHGHLLAYVAWGKIEAAAVCGLPDELMARTRETLSRLRREGVPGLGAAHEALGGAVSFEALRCIDAELRAKARDGQE
ncbi:MAG: ATP-dependent DNA helicase RecQ [Solidesulfovibrio magneticus str. Maddingley MBC34]|uniref:DNA helicase RecQ n=1 Tax=Solidesulfovibrio magneticus str. Maddingley MBC34 TaxID=1206767 RepID=K6GLB9_9BACT|nr:MAG: ATP-dependent DNA helicase RecQ [Solidesulfovibrio magneticus str. Maddingley MBC34]